MQGDCCNVINFKLFIDLHKEACSGSICISGVNTMTIIYVISYVLFILQKLTECYFQNMPYSACEWPMPVFDLIVNIKTSILIAFAWSDIYFAGLANSITKLFSKNSNLFEQNYSL